MVVFPRDRGPAKFSVYCPKVRSGRSHRAILNIPPRVRIGYPDIRPAYKCTRIRAGKCSYVRARVCVLVNFALFRTINDAIYDGRKNDCCIILLHVRAPWTSAGARLNFCQGGIARFAYPSRRTGLKSNKTTRVPTVWVGGRERASERVVRANLFDVSGAEVRFIPVIFLSDSVHNINTSCSDTVP